MAGANESCTDAPEAYRPLCGLDELPDGGARGFCSSGQGSDDFFVVRRGDTVVGYRNCCPHNGVALEYRKDMFLNAAGTDIVCYAHGAHFDVATGYCTYGPCAGESLEALPIRIEQGRVMIPRTIAWGSGGCPGNKGWS
ncbi:Rieske 2Fe-2S domain-containing protein [Dyella sp. C9]|uniref:Rieske (2Fe-2S) protein n=1 Tax=Dyella sp. C9 TaxID=2202154 RepID=UPI000DEF8992|nr:Rieske 2Fe-2S domain-containing protein [Dyella sp. C9]